MREAMIGFISICSVFALLAHPVGPFIKSRSPKCPKLVSRGYFRLQVTAYVCQCVALVGLAFLG